MYRQLFTALSALLATGVAQVALAGADPVTRIDSWVLETTENAATTEFIVFLS